MRIILAYAAYVAIILASPVWLPVFVGLELWDIHEGPRV